MPVNETLTLVIGLGNPGREYAHTRHNVGFDVTDILAQKLGARVQKRGFQALYGECVYAGRRVVIAQPQTFMNLSGQSVLALVNWFKPQPGHVLVIYDDVDLPPGTLRVRTGGSAGTHNGMRSIIQTWGQTEFPRIRVGIGDKPEGWALHNWVLSHYATPEEREAAFQCYLRAADAACCFIERGAEACMQLYNRKA